MTYLRLLLLTSLLSACTFGVPIENKKVTSTSKSKSGQKPNSYIVNGTRYHILESAEGYAKRGIASWYGKKFHGRKTSNGEIYDMFALTAAHKTLPLPTQLLVKNLENGKTITVRVNDRGPFIGNRILDLSYAAAKQLDILQKGTARVEIKALNKDNRSSLVRAIPLKTIGEDDDRIFVQIGSFGQKVNAQNLIAQLKLSNITNAKIITVEQSKGTFHRVRIGPYSNVQKAQKMVEQLHKKTYKESHLVID